MSETLRTLTDQAGPGVTDERWIDLRFQEAFAWRALRLPAKFPNSNRPTPRVPEYRATGQETAYRTSASTPADISGSHVIIAALSSLGSTGASRTSSIRVKPAKLEQGDTEASPATHPLYEYHENKSHCYHLNPLFSYWSTGQSRHINLVGRTHNLLT